MKDFRNLKAWQKAHVLALVCYKRTANFPSDEMFGLRSQIRRLGSSIPANIAEGCGRGGNTELRQFLRMAMRSAAELEYHLLLSKDLGFLNAIDYADLRSQVTEVKRLLASLLRKVGVERNRHSR